MKTAIDILTLMTMLTLIGATQDVAPILPRRASATTDSTTYLINYATGLKNGGAIDAYTLDKHSGSQCVHLTNGTSSQRPYLTMGVLSNTTVYHFSFWAVKLTPAAALIEVGDYNTDDSSPNAAWVSITLAGTWTYYEYEFTSLAPTGGLYAGWNKDASTQYLIDDFRLW